MKETYFSATPLWGDLQLLLVYNEESPLFKDIVG